MNKTACFLFYAGKLAHDKSEGKKGRDEFCTAVNCHFDPELILRLRTVPRRLLRHPQWENKQPLNTEMQTKGVCSISQTLNIKIIRAGF